MNEYLTRDEVAIRFKLSVRTLERCGPGFCKVGSRVVYKVAEVEAWLESYRVEGPAVARPLRTGRPTKAETVRRRQAANGNQTCRTQVIAFLEPFGDRSEFVIGSWQR
jgi:hypothetical protein